MGKQTGDVREGCGLKEERRGCGEDQRGKTKAQSCGGSRSFSSASAINHHAHSVVFFCPTSFCVSLFDHKHSRWKTSLCSCCCCLCFYISLHLSLSFHFSNSFDASPFLSFSPLPLWFSTSFYVYPLEAGGRISPERSRKNEALQSVAAKRLSSQDTNKITLKVLLQSSQCTSNFSNSSYKSMGADGIISDISRASF